MAYWGYVIQAVGAIGSSQIASRGSEKAANIGAGAAEQGVGEISRQFDITQRQLEPFRIAGVGALGQQQALLGVLGPQAQQQAFEEFNQSPGQRFIQERQQKALVRNQAAIGNLGGGNIRTALQAQAAGFAQQDIQNQLQQLSGLSKLGLGAATRTGVFGQAASTNVSGLLQEAGQARALGALGKSEAQSGLLGDFSEIAGNIFG